MKYIFLIFLFFARHGFSQLQDVDNVFEQQLEELSENEENEMEEDYLQRQLLFFLEHPINLNDPEVDFSEFPLLGVLQVNQLIRYRKLLGNFVSIYELQAVPGFTIDLIKKLQLYVVVNNPEFNLAGLKQRWNKGSHQLIVRPSFIPEKSKGFKSPDSSSQHFLGGSARLFAKYRYQYRNLLQYGVVAEKDAGEPFNLSKGGFDFLSFHLSATRIGRIQALVVGDYTISLGQGLLHWQSQAFQKNADVINIKRQGDIIKPYQSAGEYNFQRGVAASVVYGCWKFTGFGSLRMLSANTDLDDQNGEVVTSIQTSGMHRTSGEINRKNNIRLFSAGGNVQYNYRHLHLGWNAVAYSYSLPLQKRELPYNLFAVKGNKWLGYSVDYSYTFRNFHFFGEMALDKRSAYAMVHGIMAALDEKVDLSMHFRSLQPGYQSLYGNAFTENTLPGNETGMYLGLSLKPHPRTRIDMYADIFSFPWLKYRVDGPSGGMSYLAQVTWKPDKRLECYSRFRFRNRPLNSPDLENPVYYPESRLAWNWRVHVSYQYNRSLLLRHRMEVCWFARESDIYTQTGYLLYSDLIYKPFGKKYSGGFRIQYFESDSYDTRIYAYENDVLFSNNIFSFFDKGLRWYCTLRWVKTIPFLKGLDADMNIKLSTTIYADKLIIGSGADEIAGNRKSEVKFQVFFSAK